MKKPIYKSKAVWFNAVLLILSIFDNDFFLILGLKQSTVLIINALIIKLTAICNILIRTIFTKDEITIKQ